jgi:hypothetical protein
MYTSGGSRGPPLFLYLDALFIALLTKAKIFLFCFTY